VHSFQAIFIEVSRELSFESFSQKLLRVLVLVFLLAWELKFSQSSAVVRIQV